MEQSAHPNARGRTATAAFALLVFALQAFAFAGMRFDDAFITYRYGQNLATGHGLTFNPGEPFLGSTSPGHMLISAVAYALAGLLPTPSIMSALGCLGWTAQAVAVRLLLRPALSPLSATLVALAIAAGAPRSYLWVSLETNLLAALVLFALWTARERRWFATAVLVALACVMRPDAALLAGVLGAACLYDRRARALGPAALFSALLAPWIVFATRYYGSPLPHSALEKFQRTALPKYLGHVLRLFAENVLPGAQPPIYVPHVFAWALIIAGATVLVRRDRWLYVVLAYALLHAAAYLVLRPIAGHDWHLYPGSVLTAVFALGGLCAMAERAPRRWQRSTTALAFATLALLCTRRTVLAAGSHPEGFWNGARDATYLQVATYLAEHAEPGDRFASIEVGTLAYYSGLAAYDLGGLVTDLRRDPMVERNVRWLVLDKRYLAHAPPTAPVYGAVKGEFETYVFYLPRPDAGL